MEKTAAIIVTHNRKEKLRRCIEAVQGQEGTAVTGIIVVDNDSSDGTSGLFTGAGAIYDADCFYYFNTGLNIGGAGGFSFGLRKAAELGFEYAWLMDDDTVPSNTALSELLYFEEKHGSDYGFLSSRTVWRDGSLCLMNIQRETLTQNVRDFSRPYIRIEMASFVSLLIPMRIVREVGLPYREFFIWTDDWEYTRRISRKYPCFLVTGSVAVHDMENNIKADIVSDSAERTDRYRYLYRNDVVLYRREGLRGFAYEVIRLSVHLGRVALSRNSLCEKIRRATIIIGGTMDGLSFYPVPDRPESER